MIKVNDKEIEFREGMTVVDILNLAGESVDQMVIVVVDGQVIPHIDLKMITAKDHMKISLLRVISGG
ncbi:thiamine biosynthesis protein ThiS [Clostridium aceticum]|uniref:Thiamine biosynthesis protein ThiS n=1 Tax=Clostridium aceticum TaxID=84022 RepID=A0A0D8IDY3_9CLOT|nr:sulfur carrier protein ThiS [Clostridium aceticum]AKL96439.1 thiamine biosynthesis protein ThiS [Clostridium aceticum]KJF27386.1 hypothetical protein TZ02_08605 [Clostridium aceticum]